MQAAALAVEKEDPMRTLVALTALLVLTMPMQAQVTTNDEGTPEDEPIAIPAAGLTWTDLDPTGAPGVKIADLWGDHRTGAFGAFFRLPAGFAAPLHTHTHDMKLVIVSGTYIQGPEGRPEFLLGPGSYLLQPGGSYRHTTSCDQASECLFFVESEGAFDLHPAGAEPAAE